MSSQAKNQGETELRMVEVAKAATADSGRRCFWREDPHLKLQYSQVVEYLRLRSRNGDLKCTEDLEAIERQYGTMKQLKSKFYGTNSVDEKIDLAKEYRIEEQKLMSLLTSEE